MNQSSLRTLLVLLLAMVSMASLAQKPKQQKTNKPAKTVVTKPKEASDPSQNEKKVRDLVAYLNFMLNTLGSSSTSARDKDVLITESYSKIFRDAKVQIEDDLDEEREVVTNKDVMAYLKDINFFFKDAKFEFNIDKIDKGTSTGNQVYYKVSLHRNLVGTTSDSKAVHNNIPRFIEINLNSNDQDLKIVSIYTHELNRAAALRNWWNELSFEWQNIFRKQLNLKDSVSQDDIQKIVAVDKMDIHNNRYIQSVDPLSSLTNLKVLDISGTQVSDLSPLRNLTELAELALANTSVQDLYPLKYSSKLTKLNIRHTQVINIDILSRMPLLHDLDMSFTLINDLTPLNALNQLSVLNIGNNRISDISALAGLEQLTDLNIAKTTVTDISALNALQNLTTLTCDSTKIQTITALGNTSNLRVLQANSTSITSLDPLLKLKHLEKVYCDQTPIDKNKAEAFMAARPGVLVIYDSHNLKSWWDSLSPQWQEVISKTAHITIAPSKEELARVTDIDSINISGKISIRDLEPLRPFQKLRVVIARGTGIQDLTPLHGNSLLTYIDISDTPVKDLSPAVNFKNLIIFKADRCKVESIEPLKHITSLQKLFVDATTVNDINVQDFLLTNSKCLVVYKTLHLRRWWMNLSQDWQGLFLDQVSDTTRESLHKLVEQESLRIKDAPIHDLSGLGEFVRLRELHFSGTAITDVIPLDNLKQLTTLEASNNPIQNIKSISQLAELQDLDLSNTPVEDLTELWVLKKLKKLNCAGTQIRRLDATEKMEQLEYLDCSNTNVSKLTPLDYLHLKTLKCYNTRVSEKGIQNFKASHPDCKVTFYK
jgi:Leucine-rich repeat (LRR) protein